MFAIDRLPLLFLLLPRNLLVLARVVRRLPRWAWTYAMSGRLGLKRYSLRAELGILVQQARWKRNDDPAWLRRAHDWYARHPDLEPRVGRAFAALLLALLLALVGCAEPLVHQRALGALHTKAAATCKATPATCAPLQVCATGLRAAMATWQGVSEAIAKGDDELELARTADALVSEGTARAACLIAMPPKRSK